MGTKRTNHVPLLSLCCLSTALLACQDDAGDPSSPEAGLDAPPGVLAAEALPETLADLPLSDAIDTWIQLLPEPTARGENVVVHVALPPPLDPTLADTLVRVLGEGDAPLLLYRSDALAELGIVPASPGPGYWATFVELDAGELDRRESTEAQLAASEQPSDTYVEFRGRSPVALRMGVDFSSAAFSGGALAALGPCPVMPASSPARWEESLLITDLAVVRDPTRTIDTCGGGGDENGVWTFKHLMAELAAGAVPPVSVDEFTLEWLETWLVPQVINNDVVDARTTMFSTVIEPWATASGVTASLVPGTGGGVDVVLSGPLDWSLAPFRLAAIVNRIDLGSTGTGGYGGGMVSSRQSAGELRFVFGVEGGACAPLPFSVIFEYGVPRDDCDAIRDWAIAWTELNDPGLYPRFSPAWRAKLETMTESVVKFGAAPGKGNDNALNQMRTNENALDGQWEMREFTLTIESVSTFPNDTPADGFLRPHSVAMTPDDTVFAAIADPFVTDYVITDVEPSVGTPTTLPADCTSGHVLPLEHLGLPFRGGNAFVGPVDFWQAGNSGSLAELCARHELSLQTCSGCHFQDTQTTFLHIDPQASPAALSDFLTGGGGILSVPEPQAPSVVTWTFADLQRRYDRLYEIACAPCATSIAPADGSIARMLDVSGVVPIDRPVPLPGDPPIGPITTLAEVAAIWAGEQLPSQGSEAVELGGFIRPAQTFVH